MHLEPLELAVLHKLLDGPHPVLRALRGQLEGLTVTHRDRSGTGVFTTFSHPVDATPAPVGTEKMRFGDVHADIAGMANGAGFLLYVDKGLLKMLEAYSYEEPWPERIKNFELRYQNADRSAVLSKLG